MEIQKRRGSCQRFARSAAAAYRDLDSSAYESDTKLSADLGTMSSRRRDQERRAVRGRGAPLRDQLRAARRGARDEDLLIGFAPLRQP
jgi:hypothetical protein